MCRKMAIKSRKMHLVIYLKCLIITEYNEFKFADSGPLRDVLNGVFLVLQNNTV